MFGLKVQDWLNKEEWDSNECLKIVALLCLFLGPLLILSLAGTMPSFNEDGTTSGPYPQCLYIGLPILFTIAMPFITNILFEKPSKLFKKAGKTWEKCPYICWIIKNCIEYIYWAYIPIVYIPVCITWLLINIAILTLKTSQTVLTICTIPDGKAEAKIKQIWSGK